MARPQKNLKIDQLISVLRENFQKVGDPRTGVSKISLDDFLMSSYAVFSLKYPSLYRFEKEFYSGVDQNVRALFDITNLPSDTHLRDVMDQVNPKHMRKVFTSLFAEIQKTKVLPNYEFITIAGIRRRFFVISACGITMTIQRHHCVLDTTSLPPLWFTRTREKFLVFVLNRFRCRMERLRMTVRLMPLKDLLSSSDVSTAS